MASVQNGNMVSLQWFSLKNQEIVTVEKLKEEILQE